MRRWQIATLAAWSLAAVVALFCIGRAHAASCQSTRICTEDGCRVERYGCREWDERNNRDMRERDDRRDWNRQRGYGDGDPRGSWRERQRMLRDLQQGD